MITPSTLKTLSTTSDYWPADSTTVAESIEAGECAVPGITALLVATIDSALKNRLQIDQHSRVLVFDCEGATDPVLYQQNIGCIDDTQGNS